MIDKNSGLYLASSNDIDNLFGIILDRKVEDKKFLEENNLKFNIEYWIARLIRSEEFRRKFILKHAGKNEVNLDANIDSSIVDILFRMLLNRPVGKEADLEKVNNIGGLRYWIKRLIDSSEFRNKFLEKCGLDKSSLVDTGDAEFRRCTNTELRNPKSVLIVGSCLFESVARELMSSHSDISFRFVLFNNASELEDIDAELLRSIDFLIIQIPLRFIVRDGDYFGRSYSDESEQWMSAKIDTFRERIAKSVSAASKYSNSGLPSFFVNFVEPQFNPNGRLLKKYSLLNPQHLTRKLNEILEEEVVDSRVGHIIDLDSICSSIGKRYILDDFTSHWNHGSFLSSGNSKDDIDLTPYGDIDKIFGRKIRSAALSIFNESVSSWNILTNDKKIKLVICDLDGTLWHGIPAEMDFIGPHLSEGWPLGMIDALSYLSARGILIAICSKNDLSNVTRIWDKLYGRLLPLDRFVAVKCNWGEKVNSIREILDISNILEENVLFIDDNPLERSNVKRVFPRINVLPGPIVTWRRQLLFSWDLQVANVTKESLNRTNSIASRATKTAKNHESSQQEQRVNCEVAVSRIDAASDGRFDRCLELINKTNQFNSTGKRWSAYDLKNFISQGGALLACEVSDEFTTHGITLVCLVQSNIVEQIVLSCRTFNLGAEFALIDALCISCNGLSIKALKTEKNGPFMTFLRKIAGVSQENDGGLLCQYNVDSKSIRKELDKSLVTIKFDSLL